MSDPSNSVMKALLNFPNPSPDWRGLAQVIAKSAALRNDVTLVVESDRVRFFDSECREIATDLPPGPWGNEAVVNLGRKLSLLDWLHDRFGHQTAAATESPENAVAGVSGGPGIGASF
jgi:hypothetical protein